MLNKKQTYFHLKNFYFTGLCIGLLHSEKWALPKVRIEGGGWVGVQMMKYLE
jgi:hypothetical protein